MSKTQLGKGSPRLMSDYDPRTHCEILVGMIDKSELTIERVARLIGKHPTTLARELNPNDDGAKLGFTDEVKISAVTGFFDSRDYAETNLGRCAFVMPQVEGSFCDVAEAVGQATKEFGEFLTALAQGMNPTSEDGAEISPKEASLALDELKDVEQKLALTRAFLTGIVRSGQGAGTDH